MKAKTTGKKYYLTDDQISRLQVLCVNRRLNLSEMVGRCIDESFEALKKQKADDTMKEQMNSVDFLDFIKSTNEQIANLEDLVDKLQSKLSTSISDIENIQKQVADTEDKANKNYARILELRNSKADKLWK